MSNASPSSTAVPPDAEAVDRGCAGAARANRLGTTLQAEALRLLQENLAEEAERLGVTKYEAVLPDTKEVAGPFPTLAALCAAYDKVMAPLIDAAFPGDRYPGKIAGHDEIDGERPVVCICHHGIRSLQAAWFLEHAGFLDVVNLAGGIDAWARQVDASVPTY